MLHARAVLDLADTLDGEIEQTGGTAPARRGRAAAGRPARRDGADRHRRRHRPPRGRSRATSPPRCATPPAEAFRVIGKEINLGSPKQLQVVLFDELGMPKTKRTKTGYTTDADALQGALREDRAPVPDGAAAPPRRQPAAADDRGPAQDRAVRRPHPHDVQPDDRGDRPAVVSTDPNLQNIPIRTEEGRRIREGFVVGKGFDCLLTADYSQIEMRIMAHLSEDALLIEAFRSGQDFHSITASRVFGVPADEVTPGAAGQDQGDELRPRLRPVRVRSRPAAAHRPRRGARADGRVLRDLRRRPRLPRAASSTRPAAPASPRPSGAAAATCPT